MRFAVNLILFTAAKDIAYRLRFDRVTASIPSAFFVEIIGIFCTNRISQVIQSWHVDTGRRNKPEVQCTTGTHSKIATGAVSAQHVCKKSESHSTCIN